MSLEKQAAPVEGAAQASPNRDTITSHDPTPSIPQNGSNGNGHLDVVAIMERPPASWTDAELRAVKDSLAQRQRMMDIAGERQADATDKLQAIVMEIGVLTEQQFALVADDIAKKYHVPLSTLKAIWRATRPGQKKENGQRRESPASGEDPRPAIVSNCRDLKDLTEETIAAVVAANTPPEIFILARELVRIVNGIVELLTEFRLRHHLARKIKYVEQSQKGAFSDCPPPLEVVRDILASPSLPFPPIERIVHGPFINAAGKLIAEVGYHSEEHVYIDQAVKVKAFEGTGQQAAEWLNLEVYSGFEYKDQSDRANNIGAVVTCHGREMIRGNTPLMVVQGTVPGSGKGLDVDVTARPAFGAHGVELVSYSEQDDEMRKRITSSLRIGPGALKVDNARNGIDSPPLASLMTTDFWSDRILGKNEIARLAMRAVVFAALNQPTLTGEIARRSVSIRLAPSTETPWTRTGFRHPDLLEWVDEHRGEIIGAVARMVEEWVAAGRPPWSGRPLGSFENWSRTVGGILEVCGVAGFMENHVAMFEVVDSEGESWRILIESWAEKFGKTIVSSGDLFAIALAMEDFPLPGKTERAQRTYFGARLARQRDRVYGEMRVIRLPGKKHGATYRLEGNLSEHKEPLRRASCESENTLLPHSGGLADVPLVPLVPSDLTVLTLAEIEAKALEVSAFMDGEPAHPELMPDYERLCAAISSRQGADE